MKVKVSFSSLDRGTNAGNSVTQITMSGNINLLRVSNSYLYGPASMKDSKVVVYPCYRRKCVIQCPCKLCRGIQEEYPNYQEDFEDHRRYHHAAHLGCTFCSNMMSVLPGLNYKLFCGVLTNVLGHIYKYSIKSSKSKKNQSWKCEECGIAFEKAFNRDKTL